MHAYIKDIRWQLVIWVMLSKVNLTKSSATAEVARVGSHYAVQSLEFTDFDTIWKPVGLFQFLFMDNTTLHPTHSFTPTAHRFQVIAQYWSSFSFRHGVPLFNAFILGNNKPRIVKK